MCRTTSSPPLGNDNRVQAKWCEDVLAEITALTDGDPPTTAQALRQFPLLCRQLEKDAEDEIEQHDGDVEKLATYVAGLQSWCEGELRNLKRREMVDLLTEIARQSRAAPVSDELLTRYTTALDNELVKIARELREAQAWRQKTLTEVSVTAMDVESLQAAARNRWCLTQGRKTMDQNARNERLRYGLWCLPRNLREAKNALKLLGAYRQRGWFESVARRAPVDRRGAALPWLTYPAIDWLESGLRPEDRIFEYGMGGSTLWFSERVAQVTSVDHNATWVKRFSVPANVTIKVAACQGDMVHAPEGDAYVEAIRESGRPFDIVLVDGNARLSWTTLREGSSAAEPCCPTVAPF